MGIKIHLCQIKQMIWPSLCSLDYNQLCQNSNSIYIFSRREPQIIENTSQNKCFKFVIQHFIRKVCLLPLDADYIKIKNNTVPYSWGREKCFPATEYRSQQQGGHLIQYAAFVYRHIFSLAEASPIVSNVTTNIHNLIQLFPKQKVLITFHQYQ